MDPLKKIETHFKSYSWFKKVYKTTYPGEYVILVDKYPYSEDDVFTKYQKKHNVRLRIQALQ